MKQRPTMSKHEQGLTLVELLVALAIGLVLLGGVYQVFVSSTTVYRKNEQFARLQENARFAMEILGRDLRMAGYTGCGAVDQADVTNTLNNGSTLPYNFTETIEGFDNITSPLPAKLTAASINPNIGTDVVVLRGQDNSGSAVLTSPYTNSASVFIGVTTTGICSDGSEKVNGICQGDILLISDCTKARVFQVTNITASSGVVVHSATGTPGNATSSWGGASAPLLEQFSENSEIVKYVTKTYFIQTAFGVPTLYLKENAASSQGLVEGIENMQLRYGVDTNDDRQVDDYLDAASVIDWTQVMAVRVGLLVQGPIDGKAAVDTNTYDLDADGVAEYDPPDERRMRRVFKSTFVLRNRAN